MNSQLPIAPPEEPLSEASWRPFISGHSVYAQRRYHYHTRLFAIGYTEFEPSLITFQHLTQRAPKRFAATAVAHLKHIPSDSSAETVRALWSLLAKQPYDVAASGFDRTNLYTLLDTIIKSGSILISQGKLLKTTILKPLPEWQGLILALSILIEELSTTEEWRRATAHSAGALLAPYPSTVEWEELRADDPQSAAARLAALLLQEAQLGSRLEYNAYESLAIYRMLDDTAPR